MPSKYKLTYFPIKGLAEPIRYLLAYSNIEFEDIRLDINTWKSSVKPKYEFYRHEQHAWRIHLCFKVIQNFLGNHQLTLISNKSLPLRHQDPTAVTFGKAPVLEIDGKQLTQSKAICRYLGKEAGLGGKDAWEDLQIDIILDTIDDVRSAVADYNYDPDEKSKAAKKGPILGETIPFYLKKFDTIISENNGHFANKKLTWVDIYFVGISEHIIFMVEKDVLEPYPNLKALRKTIQAHPGIKKYLERRPDDIKISFT